MLQTKTIDYRLLAEACHFYNAAGYQQIEVPWVVDAEFSRMTSPIPGNGYSFVLDDSRHLVASAEQGFVEMMYGALLEPDTLYFAVSPCFRNEELDAAHSKWFVKLELFAYSSEQLQCEKLGRGMLDSAVRFTTSKGIRIAVTRTDIGFDLMSGDLEIGSYGTRNMDDYHVAYGTGAALPRLSVAIESITELERS